jgi:FixJ family two-component response regulator
MRPVAPDVRSPGARGGHGDILVSVRAMRWGPIEFLTKPVCEQELLDAANAAIDRDQARGKQVEVVSKPRERFDALTLSQRQVLLLGR